MANSSNHEGRKSRFVRIVRGGTVDVTASTDTNPGVFVLRPAHIHHAVNG